MPEAVTEVYFDFLCPYAWRGVELAGVLRQDGEAFALRHFSLVQGNHKENEKDVQWWLTDQPLGEGDRFQQQSLPAFLAAHAVRAQGEEAAWRFTLALFRAHHEHKKPLDEAAIGEAAQQAGLDLGAFTAAREDEAGLRASLRADLAEAHEIGVFGTPTFVRPDGSAAYFRFENLTRDAEEAREWWKLYGAVLDSPAGIATIKRAKRRPALKR